MNHPRPDGRDPDAIRARLAAFAKSYTPEWRYARAEDDPGAAIAELFAEMYYQTVDRTNALPEKLYVEFLNLIGFTEPPPMPAKGPVRFLPGDTLTQPVPVPKGTEVFTPDAEGENIVFSTERAIEATSAVPEDFYYVSAKADSIRRLDFAAGPQPFFAPAGEELQRHSFSLCQTDALRLDCPARIELHLHHTDSHRAEAAAAALAEDEQCWTYLFDGEVFPFDSVHSEKDVIVLEKADQLPLSPDTAGRICLTYTGRPSEDVRIDWAGIASEPRRPCIARSLYYGDLPIEPSEGGYCFGRRPAVYDVFYLRCDTALSKKGAQVLLRLELKPIVDEPEQNGLQYDFTRSIIDKEAAVERRPDDAFIEGVVWEYYNGLGWRNLPVEGDKNPFSCKRAGPLETRFRVPADLTETDVNSETGLFLRVRVTAVANAYSTLQRWIVPFLTRAEFSWHYPTPASCTWVSSVNSAAALETEIPENSGKLGFPLLTVMKPDQEGMYLRFDRSPHAMPLSLHFRVQGRTQTDGQVLWEYWNGKAFEPVRALDATEHLLHSGEVFLYLPEPVKEASFFGTTGYWLRMLPSAAGLFREGERKPAPVVAAVYTNTVTAAQLRSEPEQLFDTQVYEAGKRVALMASPVQTCEVWVDELGELSGAETEALLRSAPQEVRLERADHITTRCWVLWKPVRDLALAGAEERAYELDPYAAVIRFGDGRHGRVPPSGDHNIRVRYTSGGGERGNVPAGSVRTPLAALPQISEVTNLRAMSGGTGRLRMEEIERRGSRHLALRGRSALRRDFEDMTLEAFPQVRGVRCFAGRDESGAEASGHVTVVLTGFGAFGEGTEELCREVYRHLSRHCSCCLISEGRLHVCPATVLTVNTSVSVEVENPDLAADTQREILRRIEDLIENTWKARPIGAQIRIDEIWAAVRDAANVRLIRQILVEGAYDLQGRAMLSPLERESDFPYAVAENGRHLVAITAAKFP